MCCLRFRSFAFLFTLRCCAIAGCGHASSSLPSGNVQTDPVDGYGAIGTPTTDGI